MKEKLKLALWVDNINVPAWVHELLLRIIASEFASLELVVLNRSNQKHKGNSFIKLLKNFKYAVFILYRKFENRYAKIKPDAQEVKSINELVFESSILFVNPEINNHDLNFNEQDISLFKSYEIDVCIKIGNGKIPKEMLANSRYGFWAFDDGNCFVKRGIYKGVWEAVQAKEITKISLLAYISGQSEPLELYCSTGTTVNSIKKNINLVYWKSLSFITRKLKDLYEFGGEDFFKDLMQFEGKLQKCYMPSNGEIIPYLLRYYGEKFLAKINKKNFFEQWVLMYNKEDGGQLSTDIDNYKIITPPMDRFWADPAVVSNEDGGNYIFIEEYLYKTKKAHISLIEMDRDGKYESPKIVLDKPYHLSYPFVFKEGNDYFMIPETSANRTIELYRAKSFPGDWEFVMNLMEGIHAVDATLHFHESKYWLFVNIKENKGASAWDELFIFYADDFRTSQWKPHTANPVISDVRCARPAGRFYVQDGKLYRPSQDSSKTYGYAININEVLVLNENEYKEDRIDKIYPYWKIEVVATHTLSYQNGFAVLDAREKRKRN